jgi:hypothetical protein
MRARDGVAELVVAQGDPDLRSFPAGVGQAGVVA